MNKKFKFTNIKIQKLPANDPNSKSTEAEYTDDADVSGLKLLVGKTGNKRFLLRYTFQSRKRSILLGKAGDITVEQARKLAKAHHAKIAEGIDPQAQKQLHLTQPTISEFFNLTYFHIIRAKKRSWAKDVQRFNQFIEPRIGDIRYPDLKPLDVLHLQQYIANPKLIKRVYAPSTNNRVIAVVKTMTSYAVKLGIVESNVATPIGLLREDNIRDRFFDIDQTRKIIEAALSFHNPYIGAAIAMLYICGNRKLEIFSLKWCNFDINNRTILVEHSKNGKPFVIHLSDLAFTIVTNLEKVSGNPFIFPGRFKGKHVRGVRDAYHKILVEAGVTDFRGINFHTARHSVASNMISSGKFSQVHVKKQLAHSSISSSERYIKHTPESARNIAQGFSDLLASD